MYACITGKGKTPQASKRRNTMMNIKIRNKKLFEEIFVTIILALMVIIPVAVGIVGFLISGQASVGVAFGIATAGIIALFWKLVG